VGKPFIIGKGGSRVEVIEKFKRYLFYGDAKTHDGRTPDGRRLVKDRLELKGLTLACHCAPEPCHADVLLWLANASQPGGLVDKLPTEVKAYYWGERERGLSHADALERACDFEAAEV
jgi:hypothetical protein